MASDSYHHWLHLTVPPDGGSEGWLGQCLAQGRATLLHRLELTSARLRLRGLRLRVMAPTPPPLERRCDSVGVTLTIVGVDTEMRVREALFLRGADSWARIWRGYSLIGVTRDGAPEPLPEDLRVDIHPWLRLVRGEIDHVPADSMAAAGRDPEAGPPLGR